MKTFSRDNEKLHDIVLCRAEEKISTELDGETVILDISSGMYSGLDPVGTTIWNLLEKPVRFVDIIHEILTIYDVDEKQCTIDLIDFLSSLDENGLVTIQ